MSKYMRATEVLLRSFSTNTFLGPDEQVYASHRGASEKFLHQHLAHESSGPRDEDSLVPVELSHWGLHRALHGPTSPGRKLSASITVSWCRSRERTIRRSQSPMSDCF